MCESFQSADCFLPSELMSEYDFPFKFVDYATLTRYSKLGRERGAEYRYRLYGLLVWH